MKRRNKKAVALEYGQEAQPTVVAAAEHRGCIVVLYMLAYVVTLCSLGLSRRRTVS